MMHWVHRCFVLKYETLPMLGNELKVNYFEFNKQYIPFKFL